MKKIGLLFCSTILILNSAFSQNPLVKQWDKRFGGNLVEYLTDMKETKDGGYILGGYSNSGMGGDKTQALTGVSDYWIVKIDSLGNKQWDKSFGGTSEDLLYSMQQTGDGGYILGGYSSSGIGGDKTQASNGGSDFWIVKIDSLGSKQWDKTFGGSSADQLYTLQQTMDGGYILGGFSQSGMDGDKTQPSKGTNDYWVVKIDSLGNKEWDKGFGGIDYEQISSLQQTSDRGYILGGFSQSGISGDKTQATKGYYDFWVVKIDSVGSIEWDKDFGGTGVDGIWSLQQTTDGGYILGGFSNSAISGDKTQSTKGMYDYWIVKIDALGNKQWDKDFGGTGEENSFGNIFQTTDGGYLMTGSSYSPISIDKTEDNLGPRQTWIIKTDSLGNRQWDKTLLTTGSDPKGFALQTRDGCYAIANFTQGGIGGDKTQPSQGSNDYWIIKFCDTAYITSVSPNGNFYASAAFFIFPNPLTTSFFIQSNEHIQDAEIIIYDVVGKEVLRRKINGNMMEIEKESMESGIYFVKMIDGERQYVQKIIVE